MCVRKLVFRRFKSIFDMGEMDPLATIRNNKQKKTTAIEIVLVNGQDKRIAHYITSTSCFKLKCVKLPLFSLNSALVSLKGTPVNPMGASVTFPFF